MATIKIYPPNTLPAEGVTDTQFNIWRDALEIYLEVDERFQKFMPGGDYASWEPAESYPDRIRTLVQTDPESNLTTIRKELRHLLMIIAKFIHEDYYQPIVRHSTSIDWIYKKIRQDYGIEQKGIHFLNILDVKYDPTGNVTPIGFYNNYRSLMMGNLGKTGDNIQWQSKTLTEDEKLSPTMEDLILLNVLSLLHPKLPAYVKELYAHKIGQSKRIMDFKSDILSKAKQYMEEIEENNPQVSQLNVQQESQESEQDTEQPSCNYTNTRQPRQRYSRGPFRPSARPRPQPPQQSFQQRQTQYRSNLPPFCRLCQLSNKPRHIFTSHYVGDNECPSMSNTDKTQLFQRATAQLANMQPEEDDIAAEYGYEPITSSEQVMSQILQKELSTTIDKSSNNCNNFSDQPAGCNFIKPVPSQILTLQDKNGKNVNIELDTGATVSFIKLSTAKQHNFQIKPNNQLSNLADGKTKLPSEGEIDEIFYRNNFQVRFHAIVTRDLHTSFVGGNNFFKENCIVQDINNKNIVIHNKFSVPETNKLMMLPTSNTNLIVKNNHVKTILPGQTVHYKVPHTDDQLLAVQPCYQNKQELWPPPQTCKVNNGFISVLNTTGDVIKLNKGNDKVQVRTMNDSCSEKPKCLSSFQPSIDGDNNYKNVQINENGIEKKVIDFIRQTNEKHRHIFNEDLSQGYNMNFGRHICRLNWANESRPPANKVNNINYDHSTKVLLQQVCDEFTAQGVLGIPQDFDIQIQHVSPAFLVRKQRAKNKPKNELTTKDVRLVVNFGKLNDHLKNIPTSIIKPKDIFLHLGRWKYIIVMDLFQGFYQNHAAIEDGQWLGISTPFGGLRFMRRSGQGLLGQSEELDELLAKVLSHEMLTGSVARIADDLYVGGATPLETANNYEQVLSKLNAANLKISADKTKVFLESVDILGWVWKSGGFLSPSPHRINSLKNVTYSDIKCIKDLRSWIGLYKTMMPSAPNLTLILDPFDQIVAGKDSKDEVEWDESMQISFNKAKEAIDQMQTLYLPSPDDQLLLVVDAAKTKPGIGHILYAIKNNSKLPVSFHSNKLSEHHAKWHSCELEALAFATAITAEYNILKESKKPIIIAPDSKAVADAVNLIRKGQHSSNPRIQTLITNVNRLPILVQLVSGKNNLNACGDNQSRFPSTCNAEHCAICNFVSDSVNTLNPHAINSAKPNIAAILENKSAWKVVQDESKSCQQAKYFITTGKTPSKQSGKLLSEIRRLTSVAKLNNDGLLVVKSKPNAFAPINYEQIVVPSSHLPAVLMQMHNNLNHPSKSQLKNQFDRSFYSVGLTPELDKLYDNCYFCSSQKKIPPVVPHYSKTDTNVPGSHFHADIIRRRCQYILVIRDNFSSYTLAKIVKSESHKDLKEGIIDLLTPIKLAGEVIVKVDNASGFKPLLDNKDHDLKKMGISVTNTDVFNINENSVVDKACQEIELELVRIEPDGRQVNNTTIQFVVQLLNKKLRRNGTISAYEMFFNRDLNSGVSLNIDYEKLKCQQKTIRDYHNDKHNESIKASTNVKFQTGDLILPKTMKNDKHKAKDIFVVTASQGDKIKIQKMLHAHSEKPTLRSKVYTTDTSRCHLAFRSNNQILREKNTQKKVNTWTPLKESHDSSSDEDYHVIAPIRVQRSARGIESSSTSAPTDSAYQSPPTVTITSSSSHYSSTNTSPTDTRPEVYQQLDQWMLDQRRQAKDQLAIAIQNESFIDESDHEDNTEPNINTDKRAEIKHKAKKQISAIYNRVPQLDGAVTDSSAPSSANVSPETSILPTVDLDSSTSPTSSNISSPTPVSPNTAERIWSERGFYWDYSHMNELINTANADEIFAEPYPDTDFMARHASF